MRALNVIPTVMLALLAASTSSFAQRGRAPAPPRPAPQRAPVVHAQREVVRTNNFVPQHRTTLSPSLPHNNPAPPRQAPVPAQRLPVTRPDTVNPTRNNKWQTKLTPTQTVKSGRTFTKTNAGRVYDNGLHLRKGQPVTAGWERPFFHHGNAHYGHYRDHYYRGGTYISPFAFYYGVCVPWLDPAYLSVYPPAVSFIDEPVYDGTNYTGWSAWDSDNWLDHPDLETAEPGLSNAIDELNETYNSGNIDAFVTLIEPGMSVAVYEHGQYQYTMASSDFVDLTRDAVRNITTINFTLDQLHQKSPGVFSVSGQHQYRDANGNTETNFVSFVLQDISGQWTLTQVDTSPSVIQSFG